MKAKIHTDRMHDCQLCIETVVRAVVLSENGVVVICLSCLEKAVKAVRRAERAG
jgi:hypothetical protein